MAAKIGAGSGGAISRQMRKVRELTASNRDLRRLVERAEERIEKMRQTISNPKVTW